MYSLQEYKPNREPWNKGKLIGQKPPLKLQEIWAIRIRLQLNEDIRNLALFNLAIDSKLRACDLTKLRVTDISKGGRVSLGPGLLSKRLSVLCNSKLQSRLHIPVKPITHSGRR